VYFHTNLYNQLIELLIFIKTASSGVCRRFSLIFGKMAKIV
jgi:hypothetical protein